MLKIIKWIVRGIGVIALIMIIIGAVYYFIGPGEAPKIEDAPWVVQTYSNDEMQLPSRYYFAEDIEYQGDTLVIDGYWTYDGKGYHHHGGTMKFSPGDYGKIDVKRR